MGAQFSNLIFYFLTYCTPPLSSIANFRLECKMKVVNPRAATIYYSKTRKYVYTLKSNNSANTLARWRGFAAYSPKCDLHS